MWRRVLKCSLNKGSNSGGCQMCLRCHANPSLAMLFDICKKYLGVSTSRRSWLMTFLPPFHPKSTVLPMVSACYIVARPVWLSRQALSTDSRPRKMKDAPRLVCNISAPFSEKNGTIMWGLRMSAYILLKNFKVRWGKFKCTKHRLFARKFVFSKMASVCG